MKYFPVLLDREKSDELAAEIQNRITGNGWGLWAAEERASGEFIGFVGLNRPTDELPFNPCMEVGWRLARGFWGKGYATEAGRKALEFAFGELSVHEVVSFTSVLNQRSERVMKRLGMVNSRCNFQHPGVPPDSPLREHVLYRITRERWLGANA